MISTILSVTANRLADQAVPSSADAYDGRVSTEETTEKREGMSVTTLVLGLLVLLLLPAAGGFGIGVPELVVWVALVVAWVAYWVQKRRPVR